MKKSSLSLVFSVKWLEKQPESFVKSIVFLNISPYYGIIDMANKTLIVPHRKNVCACLLSKLWKPLIEWRGNSLVQK